MNYDEIVLQCFIDNQLQLFPEKVAQSLEEADEFLNDCMAQVVTSGDDVIKYFEAAGIDIADMTRDEVLSSEEVFDIGDGRYLIVEA